MPKSHTPWCFVLLASCFMLYTIFYTLLEAVEITIDDEREACRTSLARESHRLTGVALVYFNRLSLRKYPFIGAQKILVDSRRGHVTSPLLPLLLELPSNIRITLDSCQNVRLDQFLESSSRTFSRYKRAYYLI